MKKTFFRSREFTLTLLIVLVTFVAAIVKRGAFFNIKNFEAILIGISYDLLIAIGMTLVLMLGGIDLSVGSVLAFSGVVTTLLLQKGLPVALSILIGIIAAGLIGIVNGLMIVKVNIPPFVMTLGSMSIFRGILYVMTSGYFVNKLPERYVNLGRGDLLSIPNVVIVSLSIFLIFAVLIKNYKILWQMFFVGSNQEAAFLSGIPSDQLIIAGYFLSSLLAGSAGILMTSRLAMGHAGFGVGAESRAIAAAVIGGASMHGGEGSIIGTFLGVIVIALINNVFVMFNGSANWQSAISGIALIIALSIDVIQKRLSRNK
jgi:ribose transport system permease protein